MNAFYNAPSAGQSINLFVELINGLGIVHGPLLEHTVCITHDEECGGNGC